MSAPYADISSVNATNDITQILVYANNITNNVFGISLVASFFLIILIGSYYAQVRFSGRGKLGHSFAAASFTTLGLSIIMSLENGLIQPYIVIICLALAIVGVFWVFFSQPEY